MSTSRTSYLDPQANPACGVRHLHQTELADRWRISPRTLERWRWRREGPRFVKLGGRVVYRWEDILDFEAAQTREGTR